MGSNRAKTKASKINKHEVHKKKQQRTLLWVSGFLIALMVFSSFGVMLYNDDSSDATKMNGFEFITGSNEYYSFWNVSKAPKDKQEFVGTSFMHIPDEGVGYAFNDGVNETLNLFLDADFVYVISNPGIIDIGFKPVLNETTNKTNYEMVKGEKFNETLGIYQYQAFAKANLINVLNKVSVPLSGVESPFPGIDEEIITCQNATKELPVISFVHNNETKEGISIDENCILINSENPINYVTYTDMLRYAIMVN